MISVLSDSEKMTRQVGERLAKTISKTFAKRSHALVIGLRGELGAGKTTFVKGFIKGLGYRKTITSPTFLIFKRFELRSERYNNVFHVDAYRVKKYSDLNALGLGQIISDNKNIVLIEWADKIKSRLPKKMIWIKFHHDGIENKRKITIGK